MTAEHKCDVSEYDLNNAIDEAERAAKRRVDDLRQSLVRRINDLRGEVSSLRRQSCPCQGNNNCP